MSRSAAVEDARAYLALFVEEGRAEELSREAAEEAGPDADRTAVLAAAHRRLTAEVRMTVDVAADVLVGEVGLTPHEAAAVLELPDERVVAAVDEAQTIAQELGAAPDPPQTARRETPAPPDEGPPPEEPSATPPGEPSGRSPEVRFVFDTEAPDAGTADTVRSAADTTPAAPVEERAEPAPRRRVAAVVVGLAVVLAVVLAVAMSVGGSDGGSGGGDTAVDADGAVASGVTITDARTTDAMGPDGPGPARDVFSPAEAVIFWFAYEPLDGEAVVELVLIRDGEELIAPSFPLPQARTDSHVTLPRVVTEEPGSYRIELRRDGRPLVETGFEVEAE